MRPIDADAMAVDLLFKRDKLMLNPTTSEPKEQAFQLGIFDALLALVDTAPTIKVMPYVHGRWSIVEYEWLICSECGHMHYTGADSTAEAKQILFDGEAPKYCSNCHAVMLEGED